MIRILLADDHPLFRDGLRALVESVDEISVVGEARDGDEAVRLALSLRPDAVLMDIKMPGLTGIEATRRIVSQNPRINILMLTMFEDDDSVFAAIRAGARGYLLKGARQDETLRAIHAVANGEVIFGPGVAHRVIHLLTRPHPPAAAPLFPELTDREYEILELLALRSSNADIASRLVLSPKTVRNYVSSILDKLQVADRAEARAAAQAAGLGRASFQFGRQPEGQAQQESIPPGVDRGPARLRRSSASFGLYLCADWGSAAEVAGSMAVID